MPGVPTKNVSNPVLYKEALITVYKWVVFTRQHGRGDLGVVRVPTWCVWVKCIDLVSLWRPRQHERGMPTLLRYLSMPQYQLQACWCITNVAASSSSDHSQACMYAHLSFFTRKCTCTCTHLLSLAGRVCKCTYLLSLAGVHVPLVTVWPLVTMRVRLAPLTRRRAGISVAFRRVSTAL